MPLHTRPSENLSDEVSTPSSVPRIQSGRDGDREWWQVGTDRVELSPAADGWHTQVQRADWDGKPLDLGGQFADKAVALAWCERMAEALAGDQDDEDSLPA
jgi:hypothetical protein